VTNPHPTTLRRFLIWLIILLPLMLGLAGTAYFAIAQPGCATCHERDVRFSAQTRQSAHSNVACVDCHVSPAPLDRFAYGFRQIVHMQLRLVNGKGRDWATVDDARCLVCHKGIESEVVSARGIRIDHANCAVRSPCTDCHSAVAHGSATTWERKYDMETCLECHVSKASTKCDVCHVEKDREARVSTGVFAVTHGANWRTTHGMGNTATCSVCHTAAKCEKCHGVGLPHDKEFMSKHSALASDPAAKCYSCHDRRFCVDCHGTEMPHTREFTRNHIALAKSDPALCKRCHAEPDCTQCHVKHVHPGGAVGGIKQPTAPPKGGG